MKRELADGLETEAVVKSSSKGDKQPYGLADRTEHISCILLIWLQTISPSLEVKTVQPFDKSLVFFWNSAFNR